MTDVANLEEKKKPSRISQSPVKESDISDRVEDDQASICNMSCELNEEEKAFSDVSEKGAAENGSCENLAQSQGERVETGKPSSDVEESSDSRHEEEDPHYKLLWESLKESLQFLFDCETFTDVDTDTDTEKDGSEATIDVKDLEESNHKKTDFPSPNIKEQDSPIDSKEGKSHLPEQESTNTKTSRGFGLASLCSVFKINKANGGNINQEIKNNVTNVQDCSSTMPYQKNFMTEVINISPKPNEKQMPDQMDTCRSKTELQHETSEMPSSVGIGSNVSTNQSAPPRSISSQKIEPPIGSDAFLESRIVPSTNDLHVLQCIQRSLLTNYATTQIKLKLIHEGDILLSFPGPSKTIIGKVFSSKFLRRWEAHHVYLNEESISLKSPTGILESPVSYSNVQDVYAIGKSDLCSQFCLRLVLARGSILLQANNAVIRDQWIYSILWKKNMQKYKKNLLNCTKPEDLIKGIKSLIRFALDSILRDDYAIKAPVDVISEVLKQNIWADCERREKVIFALAPILEEMTPSRDMLQFFSEHCLLYPNSPVVNDVFTTIVHRILKRTSDFGKLPSMRKFAGDYMIALNLRNDGEEAIKKFLLSVHGPNLECPHPRVLPNLVAVNLASISSYFERKKILCDESDNDETYSPATQILEKQLECNIIVFRVISEFEDWRPALAQLLQPIPFPEDALKHELFIKGLKPVITKIGTDPRCEVHEMVMGVRESKGGWLGVFSPSSSICEDNGQLWSQMLDTLISCCGKRKGFIQTMTKHLEALILFALREHNTSQEVLCLMLEWHMNRSLDEGFQIITTLESTKTGKAKYEKLCERQEHLRKLQKKTGPINLTLPCRSTDADVARLLSHGSFGNLECLSLAFTLVTSSCAYQLIQLPTLRYLNLWATHFGDAGLLVIAEHLDKLQVLNLCETPVTDKGITALAGMKTLMKLNLNSTKLSPQTLAILKQELPLLQELDVRYTDAW